MKLSIASCILLIAAAYVNASSPGRGGGGMSPDDSPSPLASRYNVGGDGQTYLPGHARRPSNLRRPSAPASIRHGGNVLLPSVAMHQGSGSTTNPAPGIEFSTSTRAQQNVIQNAIKPPRTFADSGAHLFMPSGTAPLNIRRESEQIDPKSARTPSPAGYPLPESPPQQGNRQIEQRPSISHLRPFVLSTASGAGSSLPYRHDPGSRGATPPIITDPVVQETAQNLPSIQQPAGQGYQRISVHQHVLSNIEPTPEELMTNPGACVVMLDCGDFYCTHCCKVFINSHRH